MNCLILASLETPYMQSEVQELANSLSRAKYTVHQLTTDIDSKELYRVLRDGERIGLVWVCGHSGPEGFLFGANVISPRELGLFLNQAKSREVVLNSCHSVEHVIAIQKVANVTIVATINPTIDDREAWTNALYLGRKIVESATLEAAYRETLAESSTEYRWFPAPRSGDKMSEQTQSNSVLELQRSVDRLEATVGRLVRALQGDSMMQQAGLIETVRTLQLQQTTSLETIKMLQLEVDTLKKEKGGAQLLETWWGIILVVGFFILLFLGILYFTYQLGGLGNDTAQGNSVSVYLGLLYPGGY